MAQNTSIPRVTVAVLLAAFVASVVLVVVAGHRAGATPRVETIQASPASAGGDLAAGQTLRRYAEDTWASFVAMTDPETGLPADTLAGDGTRIDLYVGNSSSGGLKTSINVTR